MTAAPLVAQDSLDGRRVTTITFHGAAVMGEGDLREAIATEAQSCRSLLYQPFCWVTDSGTFQFNPRLDALELERDQLRIRVLYFRAGYRSTAVGARVEPDGDGVHIHFDINEGPPTLIEAIDVLQGDPVLSERELHQLRLPSAGDAMDLTAVDTARVRIRSMLRERGYVDAVVQDSAIVSDTLNTARLRILVLPGPMATVGELDVRGNHEVSTTTIRHLVDIEPGSVFRQRDLDQAQRRLYRSELFRRALIQVDSTPDSRKPLTLEVQEAPLRAVRLGVGVSTMEFVQTEARYTMYNWLGSARRVELRGAMGNLLAPQLYGRQVFSGAAPFGVIEVEDAFLEPTWRLAVELTQPWIFSSRNALSVVVFANRRSVPGIVIDQGYGGSATLTRRVSERTPVSLTYRYERTRVEAGDLYYCVNFGVCQPRTIDALSAEHALSPIRLLARTDQSDDPLAPTSGWTGELEFEHASRWTASDFGHNSVSMELSGYLPLGWGVLAANIRGGWVRGSAGTAAAVGAAEGTGNLLHPRKRVYSGGSRSVRGFGENQLGPRILTADPALLMEPDTAGTNGGGAGCTDGEITTGTCDPEGLGSAHFNPRPLGGTSVIEGSLEFRLPVTSTITAAVFVDAGRVGADGGGVLPTEARSAITPGLGARYQSPIGPIRVDLGVRPQRVEQLPVVTQARSEDGELRLVRLDTPKLYDPTEDGTFFRNLLSRLQLHLSIGEAF